MRDAQTFTRLEAPVMTVAGWSIHTPLVFERFNTPDVASEFSSVCVGVFFGGVFADWMRLGIYDAIRGTLEF